jgi:hypothetical protein
MKAERNLHTFHQFPGNVSRAVAVFLASSYRVMPLLPPGRHEKAEAPVRHLGYETVSACYGLELMVDRGTGCGPAAS